MRKLKEDVRDISRWSRCLRRAITFKVIYRTSGAVYCNPVDLSKTISNRSTPILFTDESGAYWTDTMYNLKKYYTLKDGGPITQTHIDKMKSGDFVDVKPATYEGMWVFKVDVDIYRWDCPYGANASGVQHGDGDYLVCSGTDKPDLRTIRLVRNAAFKRYYREG